jgi:hypothetical protein
MFFWLNVQSLTPGEIDSSSIYTCMNPTSFFGIDEFCLSTW